MTDRHPSLESQYPEDHTPSGGRLVPVSTGEIDPLDVGKAAIARLASWDIRCPENSRLPNAVRYIRQHRDLHEQVAETQVRMAEAHRTLLEIAAIVAVLDGTDARVRDRLRIAVKGPDATRVGQHDKARDTQAELIMLAVLQSGGYKCWFEEPDLVGVGLLDSDSETGIAVKRLSSVEPRQILEQLNRARKQLRNSGRPGLIVVDGSVLLREEYQRDGSADLSRSLYVHISGWLDQVHESDDEFFVRGIVGVATSARLVEQAFDSRQHFATKFLALDEAHLARLNTQQAQMAERLPLGFRVAFHRAFGNP